MTDESSSVDGEDGVGEVVMITVKWLEMSIAIEICLHVYPGFACVLACEVS